jgi:DNA modification methylase
MTRRKNDEPDIEQVALFEMESEGSLPPTLRERFLVPPFSVLDARQGYWQARKRSWIDLGIQSELGRGENLIGRSDQTRDISHYSREPRLLEGLLEDVAEAEEFSANGGGLTYGDGPQITEKGLNYYRNKAKEAKYEANGHAVSSGALHTRIGEAYGRKEQTGTSIFDPVLCEVAYRWFTNAGARVLDPFAGGSVRGIVAAKLGRSYIGVDLSPLQIAANEEQANKICKGDPYRPVWRVGDSNTLDKICEEDDPFDFVFTCPPYYDLEIYSNHERDISNAGTYEDFVNTYSSIIYQACQQLKNNRFAAIVIGDIRDKQGMYRSFFQDTIAAFEYAGLKLYNKAILVTVPGSLPVRAGGPFVAGRKLGRTHQYLLQFVKGDPKKATLPEEQKETA